MRLQDQFGRYQGKVPFLAVATSVLIAVLIWRGGLFLLAVIAGTLVLSWFSWKFPVAAVAAVLVTGMGPMLLQMTNALPADFGLIGGGVRAADIFLVGMGGAVVWELINRGRRLPQIGGLLVPGVALAVWFILEIARNWGEYGLSAPGEFRFRYLILVLPAFIALRLRTAFTRTKALSWLIFVSVVVPLLAIPLIGSLKGWGVGPESRFFPSGLSLALAYGLIWLLLASEYRIVRVPKGLLAGTVTLGAFMILIDSHRSVWVVCLLAVVVLIWLHEIKLPEIWFWGAALLLLAGIMAIASVQSGLNPLQYVVTRASALINPLGDQTSAWRVYVWRAQLKIFAKSPLEGIGFGGYWNAYVPELGAMVDTSPHSLWVQSLVKLGIVGLSLYLWLATRAFFLLKSAWSRLISLPVDAGRLIVTMGLVAAIGSLGYHSVYTFEYAGLTWIGLALAVALHPQDVMQSE